MARRALVAIVAALTAHGAWAAGAPPPASAFGTIPALAHVTMSPDGALLAMDRNGPDGQRVVFLKVGEATPLRVLNLGSKMKLRDIVWADNDTALLELSATTHSPGVTSQSGSRYEDNFEMYRIMAVDAQGGDQRMLLFDSGRDWVSSAELLPVNPQRKDKVSMVALDYAPGLDRGTTGTRLTEKRRDDGWVRTLFDVDTNSGDGRVVEQGTAYTRQWLAAPDGSPVARVEWKQKEREAKVLVRSGGSWKTILETKGSDPLVLAGMSPDGTALIGIGATVVTGKC